MNIKLVKKNYLINPGIVERLVFWAMSGMTLTGKRRSQTPEQTECKWKMYFDIRHLLEDARCQDIDGFFAAIKPEMEQIQTAFAALSVKVRDKSILFLDADGNPFPRFVSYDNPSSDAD